MFLNKSFPYNISLRVHIFIGITLGFFVLFILFFLEPFDSGSSDFSFKTIYLTGYGVMTFFMYFIIHLFSAIYYKKAKVWKLFEEIIFCLFFIISVIIIAFFYTEIIINKNPERLNLNHFFGWFKVIFFGFGTLLFISAILLRKRYTRTKVQDKSEDLTKEDLIKNITISGSLKKESFQVDQTNLVYVKSENNYVSIFYFEENLLKEKLLRSTLSNIQKQLPLFVKIHRSYIVNPDFTLSLKGSKQNAKLYLKKTEHSIPVSQPFFETVHTLLNHPK
ncbi:LytTR family transcriptional regulator DNA-binding domain-containing protein [uncultured Aquimarina sp.]|uniref:LytTR family transcriptional regulator DNA-binding domain-containing protein n=1 Tax=uncultured Aquimarina sp. TaxID=575652 RepID=UPI0026343CCD|nr:LytTR family transcriptional regulator DNA-binding domain-containing protein [uncultured Aquimarina sp.]